MSTAVVIPFTPKVSETTAIVERTQRAYRASRHTFDFAERVGLGGIASAGVLWLCAVIAYQAIPGERTGFPTVSAIFLVVAAWILLVSRVVRRGFLLQGQLLETLTDSAVAASPFLSNPQRIEAMGLRQPPPLAGWQCARVRDQALARQHQSAPRPRPVWIWRQP